MYRVLNRDWVSFWNIVLVFFLSLSLCLSRVQCVSSSSPLNLRFPSLSFCLHTCFRMLSFTGYNTNCSKKVLSEVYDMAILHSLKVGEWNNHAMLENVQMLIQVFLWLYNMSFCLRCCDVVWPKVEKWKKESPVTITKEFDSFVSVQWGAIRSLNNLWWTCDKSLWTPKNTVHLA